MKAACLLVCLGLAHGITGSIFQPQQLEPLVEPLEYINQYQQQKHQHSQETQYQQNLEEHKQSQQRQRHQKPLHQSQEYQSQSDESQYNQRHQDSQYKQLKHQSQSEEIQQRQRHQKPLRQSQEYQSQSEESHYNHKHQKSQYKPLKHQSQSEESVYQVQQTSYQKSEEQYKPQTQHSRYQQKVPHNKKTHSSSSSESDESKEKNYNGHYSSPLHSNQNWNTLEATVVTYDDMGDVIMWKNQMPVVPTRVTDKQDIEKIFADAQNAMKHIKPEDKVKFHQAYEVATQKENEDTQLNATELAKKHQYPVEEHIIKTDDGFLLTLFRIPPKMQTRDVQKRPVVFLMHGLLGSADDWLLMGPGKSLAYLLSDEGYDVWLGNARGNKYSRHVSKHRAVSDFWQFSTDEIALHDLPAMIDYTLRTTAQEKLYYIGHSLGSTAFFALTATQPEYNDKIIMMYALSPVVYMKNVRSPLFRMIAPSSKFQQSLKTQFGHGAFNPNKELINIVGGAMCEEEIGCKEVCSNVNFVMSGVNVEGLDSDVIPVIMSHLPAGTSTKLIKHVGQGVASEEFKRYDYGPEINERVYGNPEPPKYEMQKVHAPVTLFYSEEDWLAHPKDVERLKDELPNVSEAVKIPDDHFNHMDFQFSTKAPEVVYKRLINSMEQHRY